MLLCFNDFMMSEEEKKQKQNENEGKEQPPVDVDYEEKWKRALADYRNLQKRVAKEKQDFVKFSNRDLILKLLPVVDDLEEAVKNSSDAGYEKILNKMKEILKEEGVEEIEVMGKEFDPRIMEGVQPQNVQKAQKREGPQPQKAAGKTPEVRSAETSGVKEAAGESASSELKKMVNKVVRKGYNMRGELLRPARVVVGPGD